MTGALASHLPTFFDQVPNYHARFKITTKSINIIIITLFDFDKDIFSDLTTKSINIIIITLFDFDKDIFSDLPFESGHVAALPALTAESSLGDAASCVVPWFGFIRALNFIFAVCSIKERQTNAQLNKY